MHMYWYNWTMTIRTNPILDFSRQWLRPVRRMQTSGKGGVNLRVFTKGSANDKKILILRPKLELEFFFLPLDTEGLDHRGLYQTLFRVFRTLFRVLGAPRQLY